jgi:hypothetical protein
MRVVEWNLRGLIAAALCVVSYAAMNTSLAAQEQEKSKAARDARAQGEQRYRALS